MFDKLSAGDVQALIRGELGSNVVRFMQIVDSMGGNNKFVDIGVETGRSSKILLNNAIERGNLVYGIDPIRNVERAITDNRNYTFIMGDSVETGRKFKDKVSIVFIDSIHADVQVLCELREWWPLLNEGGWIIGHDTAWKGYVHKPSHPCHGELTGSSKKGYDSYGGVDWPTPDIAFKAFFGVSELCNYEDEFIHMEHSPVDLGMTFIKKKKHRDFSANIADWKTVEDRRNFLIRSFGA